MIGFIKGELYDIIDDQVIIDVGGVGYEIFVLATVMERLPDVGNELLLYTYYQVKEDSAALFGFLTKKEKQIFSKLITVNGVGPKGAMSILSSLTIDDLIFAVVSNDSKSIAKANGIGPKTAAKICIDLKDKLRVEDTLMSDEISIYERSTNKNSDDKIATLKAECYSYLENLGFSSKEIVPVFGKLDIDASMDVEEILSMALQLMNK